MILDHIYNKDCSHMDELPEDSIDLIISGPPYWDYVDYEQYVKKEAEYIWFRNSSYEDFLSNLKTWHIECFRVLKKGRYLVVNLGTVRKKKKTYALPFHAVAIIEDIGFEFAFEIVWHKVSGGRRQARSVIQKPYPGNYQPNNCTDYLLVFIKDSSTPFSMNRARQTDEENCIRVDNYFKREIANNVWHIMPPCHPFTGKHPCPFPPEIPLRLIELFSLKDEVVLDPFMGIGTTARAAKELGRHYIGYEKEKHFIDVALNDLDRPLQRRKPIEWAYNNK